MLFYRFRLSIYLLFYLISPLVGYGTKKTHQKDELSTENYEELYKLGREAYIENNYKICVDYIEAALSDYKLYHKTVNSCKFSCKENEFKPVTQYTKQNIHYEGLIRETLCLMKCKRGKINPNRKEYIVDSKLVQDFVTRKIYDYLQLCYYQTQKIQAAANAAYTHSIFNPDHQIMKENLDYYLAMPEVKKQELVNLEAPGFVAPYLQARSLYVKEDWSKLVETMESALALYFQEEEMCRVQCEKPFDMGWYPDFVSAVSNHFTFCLKCKLNCATELHTINGKIDEDMLPLIYHYLQFGYFQLSNFSQAADSAVTYLEFRPESEDMLNNIRYYRAASSFQGKFREEAKQYLERERDELTLLDFIEDSFVFKDENVVEEKNPEVVEKTNLDPAAEERKPELKDEEPQIWARWSEKEQKFIVEDKDLNLVEDDILSSEDDIEENFQPALLSPPPIIRFEL